MKKIVVIEQDTIVSNIMLKTMEMYKEEKVRVDIFQSMDAFGDKYIKGDRSSLQSSESPDPDLPCMVSAEEIHKEIDIIAITDEFLGEDPKQGIEFILNKMNELGLSTKDRPTRLMILGYYYEDLHLQDYEQTGVVDFLFKPLDQQLLLQKIEIAFKLGDKIEPSYLAKALISISL